MFFFWGYRNFQRSRFFQRWFFRFSIWKDTDKESSISDHELTSLHIKNKIFYWKLIYKFDERWWSEQICLKTFHIDNIDKCFHRYTIESDFFFFHHEKFIFIVEWSHDFDRNYFSSNEHDLQKKVFNDNHSLKMKRLQLLQDTIRLRSRINYPTLIIYHNRHRPIHDRKFSIHSRIWWFTFNFK